ncbi:24609_t:CDS:1, partial [Entrophospora sp. SA101]
SICFVPEKKYVDDAESLNEPGDYQPGNNTNILLTEILPTEDPPTKKNTISRTQKANS